MVNTLAFGTESFNRVSPNLILDPHGKNWLAGALNQWTGSKLLGSILLNNDSLVSITKVQYLLFHTLLTLLYMESRPCAVIIYLACIRPYRVHAFCVK